MILRRRVGSSFSCLEGHEFDLYMEVFTLSETFLIFRQSLQVN